MDTKVNRQKKSSKNNHWKTPDYIYNPLDYEFNFLFDPCPLRHDISLWDGLKVEWSERNFINPPYSRKEKEAFVLKAINESRKGKLCVMLIPVSTSTKLFHEIIKPSAKEIRFVKGRIRFIGYGQGGNFIKNSPAMHDSMIVIFDGRNNSTK